MFTPPICCAIDTVVASAAASAAAAAAAAVIVWGALMSQVTYKCTDFCDDEVLFSGVAHGGRTELPPDKAPSALMSVTVAEELGIFGVKPSKAMDMLTGKRVSLGLSIEAYDREVANRPACFLNVPFLGRCVD